MAKAVALMKSPQNTSNMQTVNEIMSVSCLIETSVVSATEVRHRSLTAVFAMDNTDETAIDRFMEHMGHSKIIDRNIRSATSDADPPNDWPNHRPT